MFQRGWLWPSLKYRYGIWLRIGLVMGAIGLSACGKKVASAATRPESSKSPSAQRQAVVRVARSYLGTPYQYGGTSKRGIDCSGLSCQVYKEALGMDLPRTADAQAEVGKAVPRSQAGPGDLVFFREPKARKVTHVGILVSDGEEGRFIHASTSKGVREDNLNDPHWKSRLVAIRQVLPPSKGAGHTDPPEKSASSARGKAKKIAAAAK
jgi:cell wall-associated NlpC family hydrolase